MCDCATKLACTSKVWGGEGENPRQIFNLTHIISSSRVTVQRSAVMSVLRNWPNYCKAYIHVHADYIHYYSTFGQNWYAEKNIFKWLMECQLFQTYYIDRWRRYFWQAVLWATSAFWIQSMWVAWDSWIWRRLRGWSRTTSHLWYHMPHCLLKTWH